MKIGIVGHGSDKFEKWSKLRAKYHIGVILDQYQDATIVSGRSPCGGIDIWAEEMAKERGMDTDIKVPKQNRWEAPYGYKARSIDIAKSDIVFVIVVAKYPYYYNGRVFDYCYHCRGKGMPTHVKSGGCWTGWKAKSFGNDATWIILDKQDDIIV